MSCPLSHAKTPYLFSEPCHNFKISLFWLHMLDLWTKYTMGKWTKCQERGCKSRENIVYNNNNGRVRNRDMSDSRSRAVHVCSPSHVTISKLRFSGYTCSIFEQNIRLESALNAETVAASLPRISFITTTMAAFVVATCLVVDHGRSTIWQRTGLAGDPGPSGISTVFFSLKTPSDGFLDLKT